MELHESLLPWVKNLTDKAIEFSINDTEESIEVLGYIYVPDQKKELTQRKVKVVISSEDGVAKAEYEGGTIEYGSADIEVVLGYFLLDKHWHKGEYRKE